MLRLMVGERQVEPAVAVEIADGDIVGSVPSGER
jgi:hypothetical protein